MFALPLSYSLPVLTLAYFIFAVLSAEPTARGAFISAENETGSAVGEAQTPDEEYMMFPFCRRDFERLCGSAQSRMSGIHQFIRICFDHIQTLLYNQAINLKARKKLSFHASPFMSVLHLFSF